MKTAYLPLSVEWVPLHFGTVLVITFRFSLLANAGLPPSSQTRIIRTLATRISHFSDWFYLWVELDAPGTWYANELRRLTSRSSKLVITPPGVTPEPVDFPQSHKLLVQSPNQDIFRLPDCRPPAPISIHPSVLRVLRILARLERAQTLEIASLAGFNKSYTHTLLQKLEQLGFAKHGKVWKYPGWILTRSGLLQAHQSWNLPPKVSFRRYRRDHSRAGVIGIIAALVSGAPGWRKPFLIALRSGTVGRSLPCILGFQMP